MIKLAFDLALAAHPLLWVFTIPLAAAVCLLLYTAFVLIRIFGLFVGIPWSRW